METQETRRVGSMEAIGIVQILHEVKRRLERKGYRPVLLSDKPKVGQTYLRVEVHKYYTSTTINDPLSRSPGARFANLRKDQVTPEGLERILRVEYDYSNPENNEVRWFTKIERQ